MAVNLQPGEAFVSGRSRENARDLLAQAAARDIDPTLVRAVTGGYIVPEGLLESEDEKTARLKEEADKKAAAKKARDDKAAAKKSADEAAAKKAAKDGEGS